jgi:hypothetical protein
MQTFPPALAMAGAIATVSGFQLVGDVVEGVRRVDASGGSRRLQHAPRTQITAIII